MHDDDEHDRGAAADAGGADGAMHDSGAELAHELATRGFGLPSPKALLRRWLRGPGQGGRHQQRN